MSFIYWSIRDFWGSLLYAVMYICRISHIYFMKYLSWHKHSGLFYQNNSSYSSALKIHKLSGPAFFIYTGIYLWGKLFLCHVLDRKSDRYSVSCGHCIITKIIFCSTLRSRPCCSKCRTSSRLCQTASLQEISFVGSHYKVYLFIFFLRQYRRN